MLPRRGQGGRRPRFGLAALGLVALISLAAAAPAAATPYEPNDSIAAAAGPLLTDQTYGAGLETPTDRDFFYFYATAAPVTQVELVATNLGGGSKATDFSVAILDLDGTQVAAQAFIRQGETRTVTAGLKPRKYFVEVVGGEGFGESYSLTTRGGAGAFGPFAQIKVQCDRAEVGVALVRIRLSRAASVLQRAVARVRRARYETARALRRAKAVQSRAKARWRVLRRAHEAAKERREPWCSIAS